MSNATNNYEKRTDSIPMYKAGDPELVKKEIADLESWKRREVGLRPNGSSQSLVQVGCRVQ